MDELKLTKTTVYLDKNGNPLRGAAALQAYWSQNPDEHLAYKDASDEDKEWIRQNALALIKNQQEKFVLYSTSPTNYSPKRVGNMGEPEYRSYSSLRSRSYSFLLYWHCHAAVPT